jgi:FAD/FMN-containing dehydrogenase
LTDKVISEDRVVARLKEALGAGAVLTGAEIPERNCADETRLSPSRPAALALPRTTDDVSAVLRICHETGQPVVTQGGMTGLAAGAHPLDGEVALSLEKLAGVEEVDPIAGTLTARAGTPLAAVQAAAEEAGFLCGIDLGARGSCTIGGNVATNAGGHQVLRYGMTRKNVLGLEVVQADGTVVSSMNKMLKNNTGYDWTQLFIGSEGTLGIVTRVVLGLHPKPGHVETALVAVRDVSAAMALLNRLETEFGGGLLVFEGMWREFVAAAVERIGLSMPFTEEHELLVLTEVSASAERTSDVLGALMEEGIVVDALLARSGTDSQRLWAYRESVYDYGRFQTTFQGFDISIPRGSIGAAVDDLRIMARERWPDFLHVVFGHIADSNLHIMTGPTHLDQPMTAADKALIEEGVYEVVRRHAGSVSAEHGIGRTKRRWLGHSRSPEELALMRTLKTALDPKNILNPGRVL